MSDLTRGPQGSYASYNPYQIIHAPPKSRTSSDQPTQIDTGFITIGNLLATIASASVLGTLTYFRSWNYMSYLWKDRKNLSVSKGPKRRIVTQSNAKDGRMDQDETRMDTGDLNTPINTDERDAVWHRVEGRIMRVEGMMEEHRAEAQERNAAENRNADWLRERLQGAESDNATLRNENRTLTARIVQLEGEQKVVEYQTGMKNEKRLREDLAIGRHKTEVSRHSQLQREKETQKYQQHRPGLENELKRLQDELVTVQHQKQLLQDRQTWSEQEATASSNELKRLRKTLDASLQQAQAREEQFQTDLERAALTYETEIEKWVKEVTSSKDENDALRKNVEQLTDEKQRNTKEQAGAWRRGAGSSTNAGTSQQMASKVRQLEKEKQEAIRAAGATAEEYRNLGTRYKELELRLDTAKKDQTRIEDKYKRKLEEANSQRDHLQSLLTSRTGELKAAQTFLSTADRFAGADLIKDLEQLNAEILQLAASAADDLVTTKKPAVAHTEEVREGARKVLGRRLVDLLTNSTVHDAQIVIQTAFQTVIAAHAHWIISAWFFESQENEGTINKIYQSVRNAEVQAVAGRWRQLTRNHLQSLLPKQLQDLQLGMVEMMGNIVVLAGYEITSDRVVTRIMQRFGNRVHGIVKLAHGLNKSTGEGITSSDLQFLYVKPDTPYNATDMTTSIGTGEPHNAQELITCTTDLGMVRSEKPFANAQFKTTVLVKAKVILYSEFEGAGHGTNAD